MTLGADGVETKCGKQSRAASVIELFKKSQRLPVLSRLMKADNWTPPAPPPGTDLGNFYRI